jgi:hypothetical protein
MFRLFRLRRRAGGGQGTTSKRERESASERVNETSGVRSIPATQWREQRNQARQASCSPAAPTNGTDDGTVRHGSTRLDYCNDVLGPAPVAALWRAPPVGDPNAGRRRVDPEVLADPLDHLLNGRWSRRRCQRREPALLREQHHGVPTGVGLERPAGAPRGDSRGPLELVPEVVEDCGVEVGPEQERGQHHLVLADGAAVRGAQGAPDPDRKGGRRRRRKRRRRKGHRTTVLPNASERDPACWSVGRGQQQFATPRNEMLRGSALSALFRCSSHVSRRSSKQQKQSVGAPAPWPLYQPQPLHAESQTGRRDRSFVRLYVGRRYNKYDVLLTWTCVTSAQRNTRSGVHPRLPKGRPPLPTTVLIIPSPQQRRTPSL